MYAPVLDTELKVILYRVWQRSRHELGQIPYDASFCEDDYRYYLRLRTVGAYARRRLFGS